jgi:hypothetical protein
MTAKVVPFFKPLLPIGFPSIVQGKIVSESLFIGEEKSGFDILALEYLSHFFSNCHIAGIKGQVSGFITARCLGGGAKAEAT